MKYTSFRLHTAYDVYLRSCRACAHWGSKSAVVSRPGHDCCSAMRDARREYMAALKAHLDAHEVGERRD